MRTNLLFVLLAVVLGGSMVAAACAKEITVTETVTKTAAAVTITETVTAAPEAPVTVTETKTTTKTVKETVTITGVMEPVKWIMVSPWPVGSAGQIAADSLARLVTETSGGRLVIESYPGGAIVGPKECFDATHDGTVDLMHFTAHTWVGKTPAAPLFSAKPMGFNYLQWVGWYEWGGGLELLAEMYEKYNFGFVGVGAIQTPEDFCWSHKKITSLEDFKGLKFRTKGFWGEILSKYLGASVVTLAGAEVYPALERGVIDAGEYSTPATDLKLAFNDICEYVIVPGMHQPATVLCVAINKDRWEALPSDLQALFDACTKATTLKEFGGMVLDDAAALKVFVDDPTTEVVIAPQEMRQELREAANRLYDEKAAEDPFFAKVLESQREFEELWNYWQNYMYY